MSRWDKKLNDGLEKLNSDNWYYQTEKKYFYKNVMNTNSVVMLTQKLELWGCLGEVYHNKSHQCWDHLTLRPRFVAHWMIGHQFPSLHASYCQQQSVIDLPVTKVTKLLPCLCTSDSSRFTSHHSWSSLWLYQIMRNKQSLAHNLHFAHFDLSTLVRHPSFPTCQTPLY